MRTLLFTLLQAFVLIILGCEEEAPDTPGIERRFTSKEILVGRTTDPPQYYTYSAKTAENKVALLVNKKDPMNSSDPADMYLEEYNSDGTVLWSRRFTSAFGIRGTSMFRASNGDLLITASQQLTMTFGDNENIIIRLSQNGEDVWTTRFDADYLELPLEIIEVDNGEIVVDFQSATGGHFLRFDAAGNQISRVEKSTLACAAGNRISPAPGGGFTVGSPNPAKISVEGQVDFCSVINLASCTEPIFTSVAMKAVNSENYLMLGYASFIESVDDNCSRKDRTDLLVTAFDQYGNVINSRNADVAHIDYPKAFDITTQGNFILLSDGSVKNAELVIDSYITKMRPDLSIEWSEKLDYSNGDFNQALSVHALTEDKFAVLINTLNINDNVHELKLVFLTEN